ncbi:TonB-dependent receptor [Sphingosinicella sp. LHD-64]|uniref:TonB-dependent receptor n=1 Tax=Sphingosinicella sp. LHD-64 TaxID=3072139 RepID=UPI00280C8822|nr:TonB-dependent receptor [Sphingosinicella sp. LHD-64]MDQ8755641.1 TonB-dependent receptor [Sphingosinicella sp. LHD-64]
MPYFPLLGAASALAFAAAPAFAQDIATAEEDTILVTAQLREQSLIDVPMAVTAYDGAFLDEFGLNEFDELSRFIPGFEVQNQSPNNPGFVIRGITSDSGSAFTEPRVSVFQDGVSISKSRGSYVELFDMERVEVARGPQSTLYGRGALIGAVNLIQNKADPSGFAGMVRGSYGNYDSWMAEGMVNLPLGQRAAVRVAGRYRQRDGFIENLLGGGDFNSAETGAIRGALRVEPTDRISIDVIGNYQEDHPAGTSFKSLSFNPTDPATGAVLGDSRPWTGAALAPGAGFENGRELGLDREVWGVTGIIRAGLTDNFSLTSITAYREFDSLEIFDADGISLPALTATEDAQGEQFSQELRLTYENDFVTAFIGASYFHEEGSQRTPSQFDERVLLARLTGLLNGPIPGRPASDPAPAAVFANTAFTSQLLQGVAAASGVALPGPLALGIASNLKAGHQETSTNFSETDSFDIFGDVTFRVTDRLELGVGLRYSHDDKTSGTSAAVLNGRSILGGFIGALSLPAAQRTALLTALAAPGAANIPPSAQFPVPLFGLGSQPTLNNGDVIEADLKDSGFTWRAVARYELTPTSSLYASYARGRRPELLSAATPAAPFGAARFDAIDAETVDSFEIGARSETRNLYLDGSVFYYRYDNFQTTVQQGVLFVTTNAGEAEAYGFEGQARWRASPNVTLLATYAYNHSRFRTGVRDGNRFRLSPDHSLSLGAVFGVDVGPGRLSFTPSLTWQSRVFFDDDNDRPDLQAPPNALIADLLQDETQDGYALVNARLGYTLNDRFEVELFANNLLDENYIKDAGNTGDAIGFPTFIAGEPRFYGVQATVRF